jgi:hypothetical protein
MIDTLRLRVIQMRELHDLPEPYGDLEDKVNRIKSDIFLFKAKNSYLYSEESAKKIKTTEKGKPSLSDKLQSLQAKGKS